MAGTDTIANEDEVIRTFLAPLAAGFPGALGLQDDCAVLAPQAGQDLVLTTDAVAEGVHFLPGAAPEDIAWKALAVNVSDLAGKGALPLAYLMSLAFPEAPARSWMAGFARGLGEAQQAFGCHLIGGDTDRRPGPTAITITALGLVPSGRIVRRGTARPGDRLYVSGTIGDAWLGLRLARESWAEASARLSKDDIAWLRRRYQRPAPRLALAGALREHARAAMDVSDGLTLDLGRMVEASGAGALLEVAKVPLSPAAASLVMAREVALGDLVGGGDDYELLCSISPERAVPFAAAASAAGVSVTDIGEVTEGSGVEARDASGSPVALGRAGYRHF